MTREEKAIKALKWFKAYNEEDYCGGDRIQDEHGDWYYRITEQDFEAFDTAIKALEQEPTTKNDLGVDCISRADAIRVASGYCHPSNIAKELAKLPSVTPQEPTDNDVVLTYDMYHELIADRAKKLEQELVLDKIRAEIIELRSRQNVGVLECLDIIDKYKAETEDV